jgi:hypothetical protein
MKNTVEVVMRIANQHLYFTSDDGIKEGDWYYWEFNRSIIKHKSFEGNDRPSKDCRKIIATTDSKLKDIPQIPQSFIEEYTKQGGNVLVDLEYEQYWAKVNGEYPKEPQFKPKLTTNNEVIIHLVEIKI